MDNAQLKEIRAIVESGQAANVSAFGKHAVRVALFDAAGWREILEQALRDTGGPLTETERAWAGGILSPPRRRSTRRGKAARAESHSTRADGLPSIGTTAGF